MYENSCAVQASLLYKIAPLKKLRGYVGSLGDLCRDFLLGNYGCVTCLMLHMLKWLVSNITQGIMKDSKYPSCHNPIQFIHTLFKLFFAFEVLDSQNHRLCLIALDRDVKSRHGWQRAWRHHHCNTNYFEEV